MIDLYLKKVFSTRACWWYPDSFLHWRRPTFLTRLTASSGSLRSRRCPRTGASSPRPLYLTECLLIGPKENAA